MYDSKYIESDAFLMACSKDEEALREHLKQFPPGELLEMRKACVFLSAILFEVSGYGQEAK